QRPQTAGIHWFIRFYGRLSAGKGWFSAMDRAGDPLDQIERGAARITRAAFRLQGHGEGLRSLEVRTSPEDTWDKTDRLLRGLDAGAPPGVEFGVVLHFTKDRGDKTTGGSPAAHGRGSAADPTRPGAGVPAANPTGYRFAQCFNKAALQ